LVKLLDGEMLGLNRHKWLSKICKAANILYLISWYQSKKMLVTKTVHSFVVLSQIDLYG